MTCDVVVSICLNMYLPLETESCQGALLQAKGPTHMEEEMSVQLQTWRYPQGTQQSGFLHNQGDSLPSRPMFELRYAFRYFLLDRLEEPLQIQSCEGRYVLHLIFTDCHRLLILFLHTRCIQVRIFTITRTLVWILSRWVLGIRYYYLCWLHPGRMPDFIPGHALLIVCVFYLDQRWTQSFHVSLSSHKRFQRRTF